MINPFFFSPTYVTKQVWLLSKIMQRYFDLNPRSVAVDVESYWLGYLIRELHISLSESIYRPLGVLLYM